MSLYIHFIYVILLYFFNQQTYAVNYEVKIKGWDEVQPSNPYFNFKELKLKKLNKTHMCFNGLVEIQRDDIPSDKLKVNVKGFQKYSNGWQQSALLFIKQRLLCEIIETEKMIVPEIIAASNYTKESCPPPKGMYSFTNYMPDPNKLPENIPGEQWKVSIEILDNEQTLSTIHIFANVLKN